MRVILPSFAKINLTLRVINKRNDGYHNIVSTFLKIPSGDVLYVSESTAGIDIVNSNITIQGENIVAKALRVARENGYKFPPVNVMVHKSVPPGSGLGAGSGNAAAILKLFSAEKVAAKVGADVPFLCSDFKMAMVSGIGEHIEPAKSVLPHGVIVIPDWHVDTKGAYEELDALGYRVDTMLARKEILDVYHANVGKKVGLFPNDFLKVLLKKHPKYNELFSIFEDSGAAYGWGVTGSGSAAFAVLRESVKFTWPSYIKNVLYF